MPLPLQEFPVKVYGLLWPRDLLKKRISQRVDQMLRQGLVEEVSALKDQRWSATARRAIGCAEVFEYLERKIDREELAPLITKNTSSFAKRQMTWFRKEKGIHWFHLEKEGDFELIFRKMIEEWRNK